MPLPSFRHSLKVVPHKHEGKDVFVVIDHQEQLFEHQIVLPPLAFVVASFLDGHREIPEVQAEIAKNLKVDVKPDEIDTVVRDLEEHLLLETERTRLRRQQIADDFSKLQTRPAAFVRGSSAEVSLQLDGYYSAEAGAGKIAERRDEDRKSTRMNSSH